MSCVRIEHMKGIPPSILALFNPLSTYNEQSTLMQVHLKQNIPRPINDPLHMPLAHRTVQEVFVWDFTLSISYTGLQLRLFFKLFKYKLGATSIEKWKDQITNSDYLYFSYKIKDIIFSFIFLWNFADFSFHYYFSCRSNGANKHVLQLFL